MSGYILDKRFTSAVERTDRVLEIAEAFGLGLDDKEFVIFDNRAMWSTSPASPVPASRSRCAN